MPRIACGCGVSTLLRPWLHPLRLSLGPVTPQVTLQRVNLLLELLLPECMRVLLSLPLPMQVRTPLLRLPLPVV